jgi:hypothetical protein
MSNGENAFGAMSGRFLGRQAGRTLDELLAVEEAVYSTASLDADLAAQEQMADSALVGYGDLERETLLFGSEADSIWGVSKGTAVTRGPVYESDIVEIMKNLDEDDKNALALEMFAAGVYPDIDDMYDDQFNRDEAFFNAAVSNTIGLAQQGTQLGFDTTFLKILLNAGQTEMPDLLKKIADSKAAAAAAKRGGGRVIQWADPEGLVRALKEESKGTLGRTASKAEQRKFVQRIHNMQARGESINVGAQAEAALRESSPVEAGAMDYNAARNSVMQVIMGRLGRVQ